MDFGRARVGWTLLAVFTLAAVLYPASTGGEEFWVPKSSRDAEAFAASICTWSGERSGALSLTFDDGLNSQAVNASPLMTVMDINGTFFITTDNVGIPYGAQWSEWQNAADNGHEIASHTITHPDLTGCTPEELRDEVVLSKRIIEENISGVSCETFSYPMGSFNDTVADLVREHYVAARMDRHNISGPPLPAASDPPDLHSVVPVNFGMSNSEEELNGLADLTVSSGGWLVEMIHAIGNGGYDPVPLSEFAGHLTHISAMRDELWIATFKDVVKYIWLRNDAEVALEHPESNRLHVSLDSDLDPRVFNVPVTLNLSFPGDWIDLEAWYKGSMSRITTREAEEGRYCLVDVELGQSLYFIQSNFNPTIESFNPDPEGKLPFSPSNGTSSDIYHFYLNYTSSMNRPPLAPPMVWLDLNGDGDLLDAVNGQAEGHHEMSMMDPSDTDYSDGCLFRLRWEFPPGTRLRIRFSAADGVGLEAVSSAGMGSWMDGPFINDPPVLTGDPVIEDLHDLRPTFNWTPAIDHDGDGVTYHFGFDGYIRVVGEMQYRNFYEITTRNTSTRFDLYDLWYKTIFRINFSASDGKGGFSENRTIYFKLENSPPPMPENMEFTVSGYEMVDVRFDSVEDPDGDKIFYNLQVVKGGDILHEFDLETSERRNIPIRDRQAYFFKVYAYDEYYEKSEINFLNRFVHNYAPPPVEGTTVDDLAGEEDGLRVRWNVSEAMDLDHYILLRWDDDTGGFSPENVSRVYDIYNKTNFVDRNVTDGDHYWYAVAAHDGDKVDLGNLTVVTGSPTDDVAPLPISGINATLHKTADENWVINLKWNVSNDGRFKEYRIYRSFLPVEDLSKIDPYRIIEDPDTTGLYDNSTALGTKYWYAVTAVDSSGNHLIKGVEWANCTFAPPHNNESGEDSRGKRGISDHLLIFLLIGIIFSVFVLLLYGIRIFIRRRPYAVLEE
ncbi:MAG: polysaccharide deacetylase family protein [Thermoplasmatota archaeon]